MNGAGRYESIFHWVLVVVAAIYLGLLGFNVVTRTGQFSPDSMNYVSVVQNVPT